MVMASTATLAVNRHNEPTSRHEGVAHTVINWIMDDMSNIGLDPKDIKKWQLLTTREDAILLATLKLDVPNPEKYQAATHRIQTIVRNRLPWAKVAWVNGTGWRWAIRLSRQQAMPRSLPFPGISTGMVKLGQQRNGERIQFNWDTFDQHCIVAGQTRSGKSAFVRMLIYQAIAGQLQVMIADMKERTFMAFEKNPALITPIAKTPQEADALLDKAQGEIEHRKRLFNELPGLHEKLSEYNLEAIKHGKPTLPRLLIVLDEYLSAIFELGGIRGKFAMKLWNIIRIGLAYGVHIILTAQDFGKEDLGGLRDQFGLVVCFRTKNADTARNLNVGPAATILADLPGRAYCDPFGWMQAYYLDKKELVKGVPGEAVTEAEMKLIQAASSSDWRVTRSLIQKTLSVSENEAKRMQEDLSRRGWIVKDASQQNAFCISERWKSVVGGSWTQLDGVGGVGRWTENMPENPHPSLPPNEEHV